MKGARRFLMRFTNLVTRRGQEDRLRTEIEEHIALQTEENIRDGMSPGEARRQALVKFGGVEPMKEAFRDQESFPFVENLFRDLKYGLRMLSKSLGFTAVAVVTLALGIAANTAVFSVANGILLRPLRYADPSGLVSVQQAGHGIGEPVSYPNFFDWQQQNHVFSRMAAYHGGGFTLLSEGESVRLRGVIVSSDLFPILGVEPELGRAFSPADDERGSDVAILSHALWVERLKSAPSVLGRGITLDGKTFTVIGVMPAGFDFPPDRKADLWTSMAVDREATSNIMTGRGYLALSVIARLKPGVTMAAAHADTDVIARRLARLYSEDAQQTTITIMPEIERVVGGARLLLLVLLGVAGGVLLIASANLANAFLARNLARQREIALRATLGAHRSRILRQLLTESLLLSLIGGAAGLILAGWGTQAIIQFAPPDLPRVSEIHIDWHVLLFSLAVSVITGILFGSIPAIHASKVSLLDSTKEAGPTSSPGRRSTRIRSLLAAAETALALVVLAGAGLLISSYLRLSHVYPGFNSQNLLTFTFDLPVPAYQNPRAIQFVNQLLSRLQHLPQVRSAAADWVTPFSGMGVTTAIDIAGRSFPPGGNPVIAMDSVTPDYFRTMGIPLLQGQGFTEGDNANSQPVIIINQAFARRFFPNTDPIGKRIRPSFSVTSDFPWREVVGVVGDTKQQELGENFQPEFYFPYAQVPNWNSVIVSTTGDPMKLAPDVRALVRSMDKTAPVYAMTTMEDYLSASIARNRFATLLLAIFGVLALILAAVGIYGVVSYSVSQSTHEIGIRTALGATTADVLKSVLKHGLKPAILGTAFGIACGLLLARSLQSFLYGVKPTDPLTFAAVALLLVAVVALATYVPARRATKVDPMVALRHE